MHRSRWTRLAGPLLAVLAAGQLAAQGAPPVVAGQPFACPDRATFTGFSVADPAMIAGFRILPNQNLGAFLVSVAVFSGPPAEGGELPPATRRPTEITWTIPEAGKDAYVVCRYEGGNALAFSAGPRVRACGAALRREPLDSRGFGGLDGATFTCR
jgi:hypothetical protein